MRTSYLLITLLICIGTKPGLADLALTADGSLNASLNAIDNAFKGSANKEIQEAANAFLQRNEQESRRLLRIAKEKDPTIPDVELVVARLHALSGNFGEAIQRLEVYLSNAPDDAMAYITLGEIAFKSGRWTEASLLLKTSYELVEKLPESASEKALQWKTAILSLLGETAIKRKQWNEAQRCFNEWSLLVPDNPAPTWSLGRLKLYQGKVNDAFELMQQAKAVEPEFPQPQLAIALELSQDPRNRSCEQWFLEGIQAKDANKSNWTSYFQWLLLNDKVTEAESLVSTTPDAVKKSRDMRFLTGMLARYQNKHLEAEKIFSELHRANPEDLESADQLALVLLESEEEGKRARSIQLSESNLRRSPNSEAAVATAAWVQFHMGSLDTADRLLSSLVSKIAISPQTAYYISEVLKSQGKTVEAKTLLDTAINSSGMFVQRRMMQTKTGK